MKKLLFLAALAFPTIGVTQQPTWGEQMDTNTLPPKQVRIQLYCTKSFEFMFSRFNGNRQTNIFELQINEKGFDGALKRVDISIFVPHDSKVLVRDYAKQTAKQTINGLSNIGN